MQVFTPAWFRRHQRALVSIANCPGICRELRSALRIGRDGRLAMLLPHGAIMSDGPHQCIGTFYPRPLIARQLHQEYRAIWEFAHWFDLRVANRFAPALNLGFDTLTKYPDAGTGGPTCDGHVSRDAVNETFASIHGGGGVTPENTFTSIRGYLGASTTTDQFANMWRGFLLFDTSSIGAGATISATTLSLWGFQKFNGLGDPDLHVIQTAPASNTSLAAGDFQTVSFTSFGSVSYAAFDDNDAVYSDINLNGSGIAAISKTGITKLGTVTSWDINNNFTGSWVSLETSHLRYYSADNASGTAKAPKLTVTFAVPEFPAKIIFQHA